MGTLRAAPRRGTRMAEYRQTHVVPTEGLPAWAGPDGSAAPAATLDPGLDVMLLERRGEWGHLRCSNGWEAWVDARRLVASAPAAGNRPHSRASSVRCHIAASAADRSHAHDGSAAACDAARAAVGGVGHARRRRRAGRRPAADP